VALSSAVKVMAFVVWYGMNYKNIRFSATTLADLTAARDVQQHFLPSTFPQVRGLDYHGVSLPVDEVGGDFFDFIPQDGRRLLVAVGDVAGHGIGSAIIVSGLQAFLCNLAACSQGDLAGAVRQLNLHLWRNSPESFYSTLFYACVDPFARRLDYVSAAHEPALLIRKNRHRVLRLEGTGPVLGLSERGAYAKRSVRIEEGDILLIFTDGVPDAADERGRVLRTEGVVEILRRHPDCSASALAQGVLKAIHDFTGHTAQSDDRTLAVVRLSAESHEAAIEERRRQPAFAMA